MLVALTTVSAEKSHIDEARVTLWVDFVYEEETLGESSETEGSAIPGGTTGWSKTVTGVHEQDRMEDEDSEPGHKHLAPPVDAALGVLLSFQREGACTLPRCVSP